MHTVYSSTVQYLVQVLRARVHVELDISRNDE